MGWWSSSQSSSAEATGTAGMQETQSVIASIFEPGNRTLSSSTATSPSRGKDARPSEQPPSTLGASRTTLQSDMANSTPTSSEGGGRSRWQAITQTVGAWLPRASTAPLLTQEPSTSGPEDDAFFSFPDKVDRAPVSSGSRTANAAAASPSWDQLPPSPLAGYELSRRGLVDKLGTPPHTLTAAELRGLIHELTAVEQKAKYDVDKQFASHLGSRGLHGLELLVNPCLFLTGIYLMTWKTVQLYHAALPQDSLLFTRVLALLRRRLPVGQREQLAQRHRRLMRATNARVGMTFLTGAAVFGLAWVSRPVKGVMEEAPDMQAAKEMVAYQRHTEASLKWCWYVYYHHPAYRGETT